MRGNLRDKVAIVTGASSGIGRATALKLAQEGAHLSLAARRVELLEQVAHEIRDMGREALVVPTDVTERHEVQELLERTLARWGCVDLLIANAGAYVRSPVQELTVEAIERSMTVNFYGVVYAVLAVLPQMLAQGSGHIVLVCSVDGRKGLPLDTPYVAAKFAMRGFGDVLRQELHSTGVGVSIIYPPRVDTPLIESLQVPWVSPKMDPERVAEAIVRAIRRQRAEVIIGLPSRLLDLLAVLAPRWADWVVRVLDLQGRETVLETSDKT
ncbi:MAG: SDR family NAD(P)-dependent oxidoreductase [Anaerolineales bacterium]